MEGTGESLDAFGGKDGYMVIRFGKDEGGGSALVRVGASAEGDIHGKGGSGSESNISRPGTDESSKIHEETSEGSDSHGGGEPFETGPKYHFHQPGMYQTGVGRYPGFGPFETDPKYRFQHPGMYQTGTVIPAYPGAEVPEYLGGIPAYSGIRIYPGFGHFETDPAYRFQHPGMYQTGFRRYPDLDYMQYRNHPLVFFPLLRPIDSRIVRPYYDVNLTPDSKEGTPNLLLEGMDKSNSEFQDASSEIGGNYEPPLVQPHNPRLIRRSYDNNLIRESKKLKTEKFGSHFKYSMQAMPKVLPEGLEKNNEKSLKKSNDTSGSYTLKSKKRVTTGKNLSELTASLTDAISSAEISKNISKSEFATHSPNLSEDETNDEYPNKIFHVVTKASRMDPILYDGPHRQYKNVTDRMERMTATDNGRRNFLNDVTRLFKRVANQENLLENDSSSLKKRENVSELNPGSPKLVKSIFLQMDTHFASNAEGRILSSEQNQAKHNLSVLITDNEVSRDILSGKTRWQKNHDALSTEKSSSVLKSNHSCPSEDKGCTKRLLDLCLKPLRNENDSDCSRISYDDVIIATEGHSPTKRNRSIETDTKSCFKSLRELCSREAFDCIVDIYYIKMGNEGALRMC